MNETKDNDSRHSEEVERKQLELPALLEIIDKDFKSSFKLVWLKHNILDVISTLCILLVMVLVVGIMFSIQSLFVPIQNNDNLPLFISVIALFLSFIGTMFMWLSTSTFDSESFVEDICVRNCEQIAKAREIPDDIVLYSLLLMKAKRQGISLCEVHALSPVLFAKDSLMKLLYE